MVKSDDYRLYLEERFKEQGVDLQEIKDGIASINSHLKELNAKVVEHEKYIVYANGVIETRQKQTEAIEKKIEELAGEVKKYPLACPNMSRIKKYEQNMVVIERKLEDVFFFLRHPKLFMGILVVCTLLALFSTIGTLGNLETKDKTNQIIEEINKLKYPEFFNPRGSAYNPVKNDTIR